MAIHSGLADKCMRFSDKPVSDESGVTVLVMHIYMHLKHYVHIYSCVPYTIRYIYSLHSHYVYTGKVLWG